MDSASRRIYSGGNDMKVIIHEVETRQPVDHYLHEEPVYGVSVHPTTADIFVTACSDGRLLLYDTRQGSTFKKVIAKKFTHQTKNDDVSVSRTFPIGGGDGRFGTSLQKYFYENYHLKKQK